MRSALRLLVCAASLSTAGAQTTWYVDVNGAPPGNGTQGNPYTSIQYAITQPTTVAGDTVLVLPGTYAETLDFLGKAITVKSQSGLATTIVDAGNAGSVVSFKSGEGLSSRLEGFTLRGGSGTYQPAPNESLGGGVYCVGAAPTIASCMVKENAALLPPAFTTLKGKGGGVYCGAGSAPLIQGSAVQMNDASEGGGIYLSASSLALTDSVVKQNQALGSSGPGNGGGIAATGGSSLSLLNVRVQLNLAEGTFALGGGLSIQSSTATLDLCEVTDNDSGGVQLGTCNCAGFGGGIYSDGASSSLVATDTMIKGNYGDGGGGGVYGGATLASCEVMFNHGQYGGGVYAIDVDATDCLIASNSGSTSGTDDFGLGVYVDPLYNNGSFIRCEIGNHSVQGQGGGGWGGTYDDCDIHDNTATSASGFGGMGGGGVYGGALVRCRLWNNQALSVSPAPPAQGGALRGGSAQRCLIWDCLADQGGAAFGATLTHCTVADNQATPGGLGAGLHGGSLKNGILWNNAPDNVAAGSGATVTWSDVQGGFAGAGNVNADPKFWNEPARDFHLRQGSPCIDAGDPASPPDPDGSTADMGALPFDPAYCGPPFLYCTAKVNSLGCLPAIATNAAPPSVSGGQFQVSATSVLNQKNGLLFWGLASNAAPFQGGILCVKPPIVRTPVQQSGGNPPPDDCSGAYTFTWTSAYIASQGLAVATRIFCQYWSRDPASPSSTGLTDAVDFTLCP